MSRGKQKPDAGVGPEVAAPVLAQEAVERRAYEIFMARGAEPGHEMENWLQAERELLDELQRSEAEAARPARSGRRETARRRAPRSEV